MYLFTNLRGASNTFTLITMELTIYTLYFFYNLERRKLSRRLKSKLKEYSACTNTQKRLVVIELCVSYNITMAKHFMQVTFHVKYRSEQLKELYFIRKELNYVIVSHTECFVVS